MAKGRPAEPAQSKILRGNFRADRNSHGPKVEIGLPKCPVWLPREAKRHWKQLGPELVTRGLISTVDGSIFAAHCDSVAKYEQVTRELQTIENLTDETPQQYMVQSALFTIRNKLLEQIIKTGQEFGLSPAARTKLKDVQPQLPLGDDGWNDV